MSYGGGAKCAVCEKSVYHNDPKISADGKTWHASCFKCKECKSNITLAKWAQLDGENFCKPCYKKVFMLRGKYSDVGGSAPTFAGSTATAPAGEGGAGESGTNSAAAAPPPSTAPAPAAAAKVASPAPKSTGTTPAPTGESKFGGGAKCPVCAKSVYAAEPSVAADGNKFHAACFRCLECKAQLTLAKWAQLEGKNYCKVCFHKVFSLRGKYDDLRSGVHIPSAGGATTSTTSATEEAAPAAPAAPVVVAETVVAAPPAPAVEEKKAEEVVLAAPAVAAAAPAAEVEAEKPEAATVEAEKPAEEAAPAVAAE